MVTVFGHVVRSNGVIEAVAQADDGERNVLELSVTVLICFQIPAKALSALALSPAEEAFLGLGSSFLQPVYNTAVIAIKTAVVNNCIVLVFIGKVVFCLVTQI
jgi:hypothetical protein